MTQTNDFDYHGFGHRLRVTRLALGITEAEAAKAAGRSVETWRKYEATGKGYNTWPVVRFARHYNVSLDWLIAGDAARIRAPLTQGNVAILPAKGPWSRRAV